MIYIFYFHFICGAITFSYLERKNKGMSTGAGLLAWVFWPLHLGDVLFDYLNPKPASELPVEPKIPEATQPIPATRFKG
jgi:hypothetical protein